MHKVLIAHGSEELASTLAKMLSKAFEVTVCADGSTALHHIRSLRPYAMILDLMLPYKDGLTLLEEAAPIRPTVILGTVTDRSHYALTSASAHGVGYIMLEPCETRAVVVRLLDMIASVDLPPKVYDEPQSQVTRLLLKLGISAGVDGFTQLRAGIPLYMQDPAQRLSKELYPAIARLCGYGSGTPVERSIRSAIQSAWDKRDPALWSRLFPRCTKKSPSNRIFIGRIANALLEDFSEI